MAVTLETSAEQVDARASTVRLSGWQCSVLNCWRAHKIHEPLSFSVTVQPCGIEHQFGMVHPRPGNFCASLSP